MTSLATAVGVAVVVGAAAEVARTTPWCQYRAVFLRGMIFSHTDSHTRNTHTQTDTKKLPDRQTEDTKLGKQAAGYRVNWICSKGTSYCREAQQKQLSFTGDSNRD